MNILEKKMKHEMPIPTGGSADIKDKYSYAELGAQGVFELIPKFNLNIDGSYQRDATSEARVREIARGWDWTKFGAITVALRPDGSYWVLEGGHRARAAFYRSDVERLPCLVFESEGKKTEAEAFIGINTMRSSVHSFEKYRAALVYGDPVALMAKRLLERHGLQAAKCATTCERGFSAVGSLVKTIKEDAGLAERAFGLCTEIVSDGEAIPGVLLRSIFCCAKKINDRDVMFSKGSREKLIRRGLTGLMQDMQTMKIKAGRGGEVTGALAILERLNHGRRTKRLRFVDEVPA